MSVTTLPASTGTSLAPHVEVGGNPLPAAYTDALLELRVLLGVGTIGRCTLRFAAPGFALATGSPFVMDEPVTVKARGPEQGATLETVLSGVVTSVGIDHRADRSPELVVVVQDKAWTLAHTAETATLTQKTYTAALEDLVAPLSLDAHGLPTAQHAYLLRSGTVLSFVDEIARRTGAGWVVHEDTVHVWTGAAVVAPAVTLAAGSNLEEFSLRVTDDVPGSVTVRGWDARQQSAIEATVTVPRSLPGSLGSLTGALPASSRTVLAADVGPVDATEANDLAGGLAAAHGRVLARGRGPVRPDLRPGGTVTVRGMGPGNATYPVREVEHVYTRAGFRTRFVAGDRATVAGPPAAMGAAAGVPGSPGFRHDGLVVGTVERLSIQPGDRSQSAPAVTEQVMVLVTLPGVDGALLSHWARVATIGAGRDSGVEFLPEIGDEVVVGFEGGDARRPVVLGGLHGAKSTIPTGVVQGDKVARRRIVSRRGHVIEIGDGTSDAEEFIRLHLQGEQVSLRLGKDRADLTLPSGKPLKVKVGDTFLEMDGNGAVKVEGTTVTLKGTQKVTVEGAEIVLKGTQKVSVSATQVEVKGQAQATVEASGQTVIKGGMVQIN